MLQWDAGACDRKAVDGVEFSIRNGLIPIF